MEKETMQVLRGFMNLSLEERNKFLTEVRRYTDSDFLQKAQMKESYEQRVNLGPLSSAGTCKCCGK